MVFHLSCHWGKTNPGANFPLSCHLPLGTDFRWIKGERCVPKVPPTPPPPLLIEVSAGSNNLWSVEGYHLAKVSWNENACPGGADQGAETRFGNNIQQLASTSDQKPAYHHWYGSHQLSLDSNVFEKWNKSDCYLKYLSLLHRNRSENYNIKYKTLLT